MHAHLFFHIHILLAYARTHTRSHVPPSHSHAHTIQCYCRHRFLFLLSLGWISLSPVFCTACQYIDCVFFQVSFVSFQSEFFNVLVSDSTHLLQEKIGLKMYTVSCAQRKITGEWTTCRVNALLYRFFCLDNCLARTGTWKMAKRHRRNLNSDWRTKRTSKKRV